MRRGIAPGSPFQYHPPADLASSPRGVYHDKPTFVGSDAASHCSSLPGKEPMQYNPANPLIVQGDRTILLEVDNPLHAEARDAIAPFAELEKSPEHIHTYRLTPLSLWNAAAAGMSADAMVEALATYSKFPLPAEPAGRPPRAGQPLRPRPPPPDRRRAPADHAGQGRCSRSWRGRRGSATTWASGSTRPASPSTTRYRGVLKQALIAVGYPAEDLAGYTEGAALAVGAPRGRPLGPCRSRSATTSGWPSTRSTPAATSGAARASSSCPAARARRSSASPRWRP